MHLYFVGLLENYQEVLRTGVPPEQEFGSDDGPHWCTENMLPWGIETALVYHGVQVKKLIVYQTDIPEDRLIHGSIPGTFRTTRAIRPRFSLVMGLIYLLWED